MTAWTTISRLALIVGAFGAASAARAAEEEKASSVQEVIVTAQRRAERLQDVPIAITALTEQALSRQGINSTADLARVTPGLVMPYYGIGLQPSLRGVSAQGAAIGDAPNIAIYLDEIYQPMPSGNTFELPDAKSIEVLKGPQGTLYGQNATGGAIIVTTQAPSFTPTGKFKLGLGKFNQRQATGFYSGPINDILAFSIAGGFEKRDGYRKNVVSGQKPEGLNSKLIRGKLLLQPSSNIRFTATGFWGDRFDSTPMEGFAYNRNSVSYALFPTAPSSGKHTSESDPDAYTRMKLWGGSLRGEFDTDIGVIHSTTSYVKTKYTFVADVDYSVARYADTSISPVDPTLGTPQNTRTFINEVYLTSKEFGPVSFTAGVFYLNATNKQSPSGFILHSPVLPPTPIGPAIFVSLTSGRVEKQIWAGYVEGTYRVSDKITLTLGGRYSTESQRVYRGVIPDYTARPYDKFDVAGPLGTVRFSKFVPRFTARYALDSQSNLYVNISQGFKSGVINSSVLTQPPAEPEVLTSYEVGYKGRPVDNLSVAISAYHYNYKNLQVFRYVPPVAILENAAKARINGVDLDATWDATEQLTLSLGVSFLDTKYVSFPQAAILVPVPLPGRGNANATADLKGLDLQRAPKVSGNIAVDYHVDTEAGRFGAFASAYYNDGYNLEVSGHIRQKSYVTVDGELSWAPKWRDGLRFVVWGRNLTDKFYIVGLLQSTLADGASPAPPRNFGVRVEYSF